jgi:hypothetical protein
MDQRESEIIRSVNGCINQALASSDTRAKAIEAAGECVRGVLQGLSDEEADLALDTLAEFHSRHPD